MQGTLKLLKWFGVLVAVLLILLALIYAYLVLSFDSENQPENHGKTNSEIFLGEGQNQPMIVGLGGSEGGNAWASDHWKAQRDSFVAKGYAFLALAYFGEPGTPENLDRIALEGVHDAIIQAAQDSRINEKCIILIGGSKGAELALLLGSHYPDIKSVVAIVPGEAVFPALTIAMNTPSFSLEGEDLPFVPVPSSATIPLISGDLRAVWEEMLKDEEAVKTASINVENIDGPIFFVSATEDELWPSTEMSESMVDRLRTAKFPHHVEHLAVEGDHSSPLDHFDEIERFLEEHVRNNPSNVCSQ